MSWDQAVSGGLSIAVALVLTAVGAPQAAASSKVADPAVSCVRYRVCVTGDGDDNFELSGIKRARPVASAGSRRPTKARAAAAEPTVRRVPVARPVLVMERTRVPTCSGNHPVSGADVLCTRAVETCRKRGVYAMWEFTRTRNTRTGQATAWDRQPGFGCYGGQAPAAIAAGPAPPVVDPRVAIPGW